MRMLDKILDSYWTNVTLGCWGIKWVWEVSWAGINWKSKDHLKACVGGVRSWPKGVRLAIMRPAGLTLVNMSAIHLHKLPTPPTHFLPHWSSVVTPQQSFYVESQNWFRFYLCPLAFPSFAQIFPHHLFACPHTNVLHNRISQKIFSGYWN